MESSYARMDLCNLRLPPVVTMDIAPDLVDIQTVIPDITMDII